MNSEVFINRLKMELWNKIPLEWFEVVWFRDEYGDAISNITKTIYYDIVKSNHGRLHKNIIIGLYEDIEALGVEIYLPSKVYYSILFYYSYNSVEQIVDYPLVDWKECIELSEGNRERFRVIEI